MSHTSGSTKGGGQYRQPRAWCHADKPPHTPTRLHTYTPSHNVTHACTPTQRHTPYRSHRPARLHNVTHAYTPYTPTQRHHDPHARQQQHAQALFTDQDTEEAVPQAAMMSSMPSLVKSATATLRTGELPHMLLMSCCIHRDPGPRFSNHSTEPVQLHMPTNTTSRSASLSTSARVAWTNAQQTTNTLWLKRESEGGGILRWRRPATVLAPAPAPQRLLHKHAHVRITPYRQRAEQGPSNGPRLPGGRNRSAVLHPKLHKHRRPGASLQAGGYCNSNTTKP